MLINNYMDHLKIYDLDFFSNFSFTNRTLADTDVSTIARNSIFCPKIMRHFFIIDTQLPGMYTMVDYLAQMIYLCKKLSHHFLLHFPIGIGSYDHHAKYQGVFP